MAEELVEQFKGSITEIKLLPSGGGVFEVMLDDKLVFSKKELDRFPESGEISKLIKETN